MAVIISVYYPMWYRSYRQTIKDSVNSDDFSTAQTLLNSVISEHDQYLIDNSITNDGVEKDENLALHHAFDHLEEAGTNSQQKQATIDSLNED